jgi:hypothetical protein
VFPAAALSRSSTSGVLRRAAIRRACGFPAAFTAPLKTATARRLF